jgi:hypothetical protein
MEENKLSNSELSRLRRSMGLRELILHMRRGAPVVASTPQPKQDPQEPPKVEPTATSAVARMEPLSRRRPEYPDPPECIAKPWKKPWDK